MKSQRETFSKYCDVMSVAGTSVDDLSIYFRVVKPKSNND